MVCTIHQPSIDIFEVGVKNLPFLAQNTMYRACNRFNMLSFGQTDWSGMAQPVSSTAQKDATNVPSHPSLLFLSFELG